MRGTPNKMSVQYTRRLAGALLVLLLTTASAALPAWIQARWVDGIHARITISAAGELSNQRVWIGPVGAGSYDFPARQGQTDGAIFPFVGAVYTLRTADGRVVTDTLRTEIGFPFVGAGRGRQAPPGG